MAAYTKSKGFGVKAIEATVSQYNPSIVPNPIGGPPEDGQAETNAVLRNSNLVVKITPCSPNFEAGTSVFRLDNCFWKDYVPALLQTGFAPDASAMIDRAISINCQAESFPTDTFQNDYGDSFLNQITDIGADAFQQIAQFGNAKTGTENLANIEKFLKDLGGDTGGISGKAIGFLGAGVGYGKETILKLKNYAGQNKLGKIMAHAADRLLAGARIDFPMIWKNSSYNPTFSCNVRLYNPSPKSHEMTMKYIIGPLAALLTLALPSSDNDDLGYTWPFFCKVECNGVFEIKSGAISNITVTKGGSDGIVAQNQRLGMVDVRIDFINLHNVMTIKNSPTVYEERPTLMGYLNNMRFQKQTESVKMQEMTEASGPNFGAGISPDLESAPVPRISSGNVSLASNLSRAGGGFYNT